ncbi:squalene/phytoene synthase family protein [Caenimonas sedimenti]|nr:squalene/phytoene synthase family protein [Caenimonas sedimenti]
MTMQPPARSTEDLNALLRGVSRSFYLSIRVLPAPLRRPIGLGYLLARATDTLADTTQMPAAERLASLDNLTAAIDGTATLEDLRGFAGRQADGDEQRLILALPQCLAALAATEPQDQEAIRGVLRQITRGQKLDVQRFGEPGPCRALENADQLNEYTYLVAGSVGEFWTDLCLRHLRDFAGAQPERMRELGRAYGCGLQLVNILRDVRDDLAAGRCYFPADELAQAGLAVDQVAREPALLLPLWHRWQALAEEQVADGMRYADAVKDRRVRAASALPALLGARTLALLEAAGPAALEQRIKMPRSEVHGVLLRLLFTRAGRAPLQAHYARLAGKVGGAGWDNAGR